MKTERMTLLIAPADKAAIAARAESLGMSVSELVRQAALGYDPEEVSARAEVEALLPEFSAAIGRIDATLDRILERSATYERELERLRSPEHHQQVRARMAADPGIDWNWIEKVRAGALQGKVEAA
jgi:hypothetical protein